jgi:hypothetical protein
MAGGDWELAGKIGGDLAGDVGDSGKFVMGLMVQCVGRWVGVLVSIRGDGSRLG